MPKHRVPRALLDYLRTRAPNKKPSPLKKERPPKPPRKPYDTTSRMRGPRHPLDEVRMGYLISKAKYAAILHYAYNEHLSMREVAEKAGVSKRTVERYYPRDAICPCGELLVKHRADCSYRLKKHPLRHLGRKRALERGRETQRRSKN